VEELKRAGIKILRNKKWTIKEGVVMRKEKIYIQEGKLRREVI